MGAPHQFTAWFFFCCILAGTPLSFAPQTAGAANPTADRRTSDAPPPHSSPGYVGRGVCGECHPQQVRLWRGSHHALAMQKADETSVLGSFDGRTFTYAGITSTFFRRDGGFFVRTDGPDGSLRDFAIKYTFGATPLQQYLIEFPGGRLQALGLAWDTRPENQGGQRWFHLYPDLAVTHNDELHWTGRRQNWNFMCAECHSTHLEKNYDQQQRRYHTSWSEINVSCEACHGPGSNHVAWARRADGWQSFAGRHKGLTHLLNVAGGIRRFSSPESGRLQRGVLRTTGNEIEVCAACHSRRAQVFEDDRRGQPLMESFLPALLDEGLYFPDGQVQDEVYVYGSFLQSRMYRGGVTCSDCHDPHSLTLRKPGNGVCLQCHAQDRYDTSKHHYHPAGSRGSGCVDCHMPARVYMVVDPRRDHSLRIPRPDLSVQLGTPNPCSDCHADQPVKWAAAQVRRWYGHLPAGYQDYAEDLHAARQQAADAESRLIALLGNPEQPAIARATAARTLGTWPSPDSLTSLAAALGDSDPMVKLNAAEALRPLPPQIRWQFLAPLLRDPLRTLRLRAVDLLADLPSDQLLPAQREDLARARQEFLAAQQYSADDPSSQVILGNYYLAQGKVDLAESAFLEALTLDSRWVPAYVNLADLFRSQSRDQEGEKVLSAGISLLPEEAALHHSLGLLQVRQKRLPKALVSLKRAADLAPEQARYAYVYAVALDSAGQPAKALAAIDEALGRAPGNQSLRTLRDHIGKGVR